MLVVLVSLMVFVAAAHVEEPVQEQANRELVAEEPSNLDRSVQWCLGFPFVQKC